MKRDFIINSNKTGLFRSRKDVPNGGEFRPRGHNLMSGSKAEMKMFISQGVLNLWNCLPMKSVETKLLNQMGFFRASQG